MAQDETRPTAAELNRRDFISLAALAAAGTLTAGRRVGAAPAFSELVPPDKKLDPRWLAALTARGQRTVYTGAELEKIGMPCGGLCSGQLYLGGDGKLWHWNIMNQRLATGDAHYARPPKPSSPFDQGFALRVTSGGVTQQRALDARGFEDIRFTGEYPLAWVEYADPGCPIRVTLEAGAPFIPLDAAASSLPATLLRYTLRNTGTQSAEVELAGWLENAVCQYSGIDGIVRRRNAVVRTSGLLLLDCSAVTDPQGAARPRIVFEEFEGADWGQWEVSGTAFGPQPSRTPGRDQRLAGFQGKALANSYPNSDAPQGRLLSPPFTISRRFINFLIGGGNHPKETCLNLLVGDKVVRSATGKDTDAMVWSSFNVTEFEGQTARLEILDRHSGGWGHIDIDQIEFDDLPRLTAGALDQSPDYGTLGLALLDAQPTDRGVSALPDAGIPAGLFGGSAGSEAPVEYRFSRPLRGALSRSLTLAPGAQATVTFAVCWSFPNLYHDRGGKVGRHYAQRFPTARAVAEHLGAHSAELTRLTRLWHDTWYDSTLPYWLLDRTLLNVSILATATAYRWANGRLWGWEGVGCCEGTCTHVWHYAQAAARLQPELERSVRELQDFGVGFNEADGQIGMRGEANRRAAIDGHAGSILRVYREHQMSPDSAFLKRLWPKTKQAVEWLIGQDANADGVIESAQHNTLDMDWYGPVAWLSSLYLAALRAGEAMATELGDAEFASKCRTIAAAGRRNIEERLYDGEYFIHLRDPKFAKAVGAGKGCEIDQVFGQHWCRMVGLPPILDEAKVKSALASIYRYSFAPDVGPFRAVNKPGRWYAMPGEGGLLMCTFPKGGQEEACGNPFVWSAMYFNECMNGFEYQAAAHMVWEGLVTEGLAVTRAVHDRYHASKRNPFNEVECGDHYARSMASYGVFLAVCGYEHHGPQSHLGFAPRLSPENFRAAFTAAEGWGTFSQAREAGAQRHRLTLAWGRLRLRTFACQTVAPAASVQVTLDGQPVPATVKAEPAKAEPAKADGARAVVTLGVETVVAAGKTLELVVR